MWLNLWMMEEWNDYRRVHSLFVMNGRMKMIHRTVDEKHRTSERETNQFRTQKSQSVYSSVLPIESNMTYQPIFDREKNFSHQPKSNTYQNKLNQSKR